MSLLQATNQVTEDTNRQQFKVILRSPNNLPNATNTLLHIDSNLGFTNLADEVSMYGYDFLLRYQYRNPLVYNAYFKIVESGKQTIRKSSVRNTFAYLTEYVENYSSIQLNRSTSPTTGEFFYIMFSLQAKV